MQHLQGTLDAINRARLSGAGAADAEAGIETRYGPSIRLFAYGSLRPGEQHHLMLDDAAGDWTDATVRGRLSADGWGATLGYPAITLDPTADEVAGVILVSPHLRAQWPRLDEFEGDAYCRLLAWARTADGSQMVVNVYALRDVSASRTAEPAPRASAPPIAGGCLCGAVRYEVRGPFLRAGHCHCSRCRRHSGAAFGTQGRVRRQDFKLLSGTARVRVYHPAGGMAKAFCEVCGSSLFGGTWPDGPEVSIRLGSVDGDPGIRPQCHTHVASRAVWDEILDDLPQYDGGLPPSTESEDP